MEFEVVFELLPEQPVILAGLIVMFCMDLIVFFVEKMVRYVDVVAAAAAVVQVLAFVAAVVCCWIEMSTTEIVTEEVAEAEAL